MKFIPLCALFLLSALAQQKGVHTQQSTQNHLSTISTLKRGYKMPTQPNHQQLPPRKPVSTQGSKPFKLQKPARLEASHIPQPPTQNNNDVESPISKAYQKYGGARTLQRNNDILRVHETESIQSKEGQAMNKPVKSRENLRKIQVMEQEPDRHFQASQLDREGVKRKEKPRAQELLHQFMEQQFEKETRASPSVAKKSRTIQQTNFDDAESEQSQLVTQQTQLASQTPNLTENTLDIYGAEYPDLAQFKNFEASTLPAQQH